MSSGRITQRHAKDIAAKLQRAKDEGVSLDAQIIPGKKHDLVSIRYDNVLIGTYMIRRSKKEAHDLTARGMYLSITEAVLFSTCNISNEKYVEILKQKHKLPKSHETENNA